MEIDDRVASAREWTVERLDLPAYLARVGIDAADPPTPDLAGLGRLHRAHQLSIPFENADIMLGRAVELDLDAIQRKLVARRRGGYCHEHNLLFAAVLERLGFQVVRLSGRVRVGGGTALRPRTHMMLRVAADGPDLLADVGFGGTGPLEPLVLRAGAPATQGGWSYRLAEDGPDGWVLSVREGDGWSDLYAFGPDPAHLVDYVVATHYTSTHPRSPFTGMLRVGLAFPDHRLQLHGRRLGELRPDGARDLGELDDDALARALTETFGLRLGADELRALTRLP